MPRLQEMLSQLTLAGARAAAEAGVLPADLDLPEEAPLTRPKRAEWGDFSSALPLALAKAARMPPPAVAEAIRDHLPPMSAVARATVSAPGFVNFELDPAWIAAQVETILAAGPSFADLAEGSGRAAQVEFVSANPTGPLTVGHGRGGVIGDTMANLLEAAGYRVTREFYFNNAGRQMQRLGESLRARYLQALGRDADVPEDGYQGDYLVDMARDLVEAHGEGWQDAGWQAFTEWAERRIRDGHEKTMADLGIRMDNWFNERSLYDDGSVESVIRALRERGFVYDRDGAVWFKATALGGPEDRVIVRSTGEPTYRLPDIAYHVNKLERGFDLVVDVLGADHKDAFPDVLRGVQALGYDTQGIRLLMNQFVTFKGGRMSKRSGHFTTLADLIEEVGGDVARYFLLMRAPETHLEFDLDLAREHSDTNPVYYVQYAHARLCSILRLAEERAFSAEGADTSLLVHPAEQALVRRLLDLSEAIHLATVELAPHHVTTYARDLASDFHAFYRDCRVLDPDDPARSRARLRLVLAARIGLARALRLVGVSAPEEM